MLEHMPGIARLWDYYRDWMQRANKWNPQRITAIPQRRQGSLCQLSPSACTAVWSSRAGLGPAAELPGVTQGVTQQQTLPCSGPHIPKAGPASSLSKATPAPAACLCAFYSYTDYFVSTLHVLPASYMCTWG